MKQDGKCTKRKDAELKAWVLSNTDFQERTHLLFL